ncbi:MAG: hypothetical protein V4714_19935, partial [Bacteroidota bacterium]
WCKFMPYFSVGLGWWNGLGPVESQGYFFSPCQIALYFSNPLHLIRKIDIFFPPNKPQFLYLWLLQVIF